MATEDPQDVPMESPPAQADQEPKYGGYSRFEIELEFVQSLANPAYLNHLASQKLLSQPAFVAYLAYLQYWSKPPYLKYLTYPGPTLRHLELLQQETFRQQIISPDVKVPVKLNSSSQDDTEGKGKDKDKTKRGQGTTENEGNSHDSPRKRKSRKKKRNSATPRGTDS
ncbi:mediator of RNA polymerase II transcription subunit 31 [Fusarium beomiforme]|uniref:Mediator of RNA polymerase II transcription subunit 31 n=1 Tax=Fusarium beomiforme TaxID=44412 RepID=A0A9P5A4H8_9HYPO|nr:mediator of RNA polymerase II transcription subunit 31 [Fusarium beomiforme]